MSFWLPNTLEVSCSTPDDFERAIDDGALWPYNQCYCEMKLWDGQFWSPFFEAKGALHAYRNSIGSQEFPSRDCTDMRVVFQPQQTIIRCEVGWGNELQAWLGQDGMGEFTILVHDKEPWRARRGDIFAWIGHGSDWYRRFNSTGPECNTDIGLNQVSSFEHYAYYLLGSSDPGWVTIIPGRRIEGYDLRPHNMRFL